MSSLRSLAIVLLVINSMTASVESWKNIAPEMKDAGNAIMEACVSTLPISKETVLNARNHIFPADGTEEQAKFKCYLKCTFEQLGVWVDGTVDTLKQEMMLPEQLKVAHKNNRDTCNHLRGTDECDTAYQIMDCYRVTTPEIYVVF